MGVIMLRMAESPWRSHFYYTGSYTADRGKWRGELTTNQHTKSAGVLPRFGGREVTTGFSGTYTADSAEVQGAALVGKTSVMIHSRACTVFRCCDGPLRCRLKVAPLPHDRVFAIMQWMPFEPFTVCVTRRSAARLQSV